MINRNYDKKLWKKREREIDDRQMHAGFHEIQREEFKSAKAGFLEDVREARKGSSRRL